MPTIIPETQLPNGMKIFCLREEEVPVLYEQIQEYIKYGIKLHVADLPKAALRGQASPGV